MRNAFFVVFALTAIGCAIDNSERKSGAGGDGGAGPSTGPFGTGAGAEGGGILTSSGGNTGAGGGDCDNVLDVIYRDFDESHPDFEMAFSGDVVRLQLVAPALGSDQRPVFLSGIGCPQDPVNPTQCANWTPPQAVITSSASFHDWYHTSAVNIEIPKTLTLEQTSPTEYLFDSNAFFPLDPSEGFGPSPAANNPGGLNFLFTTEIHVAFTYEAGQVFTFRGDDDLWIFVNGKLALDIGSMHIATAGTIDFDAQAAALGISPGNAYPMDIFQAERHTSESNFRFQTNISCFTPVPPPE